MRNRRLPPYPLLLLLAACSSTPEANPEVVAQLVKAGPAPIERRVKVEAIETEPPAAAGPYRIGVNDVLNIVVVGHPELTATGSDPAGVPVGTRVQSDGRIYPAMIDGVTVAGKTTAEVRDLLKQAYAAYLKDPQVSVEMLRFESQRFYVLGHVQQPLVLPVDGNTTLLDGIARAGGIKDTGDIEGAYVIRSGKLLSVSLGDILLRGDTSRNVAMQNGDMVYVPDKTDWKVYVLGEVRQPGIVPMDSRGLNLADAIAAAEGLDLTNSRKSEITIFRGGWQHPQAFRVSITDVYQFGASIPLHPGDRVVVGTRGLATWARTITLLTPWMQSGATIAAVAAAVAAN
ncbi:MAG TPA: polysaccharide biosynthesis/export family protein [Planctomycetota bacterium]|nr:polysaccharide biosynthesis/export family protein [Planctomycetota bacterium]